MSIYFHENFSQWENRSKAIDLFRLAAILGVVLTHIPYSLEFDTTTNSLTEMWRSIGSISLSDKAFIFFKYGLGHVASPALSLVSAWFLLRTLEKKSATQIVVNKSKNLMFPYLFWGGLYCFLLCYFFNNWSRRI